MAFEIRIIEKTTIEVPRQEWKYLVKEPDGKETAGWTPVAEVPKTETVETERLRQVVETLDLNDVIRAINGL